MNLDTIRKDFPVLNNFTYLNTASSGILSQSLLDWRRDYDTNYLQQGSLFRKKIMQQNHEVKETIGKVFHCSEDRISLINNFSLGMNAILEGLPKMLKVLTIQGDYPSIILPLDSRSFTRHEIPLFTLSEATIAESIKEHSIDMICVSMTQWRSGFHLKQDFFERLRKDFPNLIILVDGTQFMGTAPFNFDQSGIDILITSAYKWLLSGYGCGFMLFSRKAIDLLQIKSIGNNTIMARAALNNNNPCQLFEPGHLDYLAFGSMKRSIEYLNSIGLKQIEKNISKVSLHTKTQLVHMGMLSPQSLGGAVHRNIIHFLGSERLAKFLEEHKILVTYRDGIRLSIHFYNTEGDVNQFLKAVRIFR